ncbi:PAS-domain containing protein [Roseibium album]|uniref:sensor domain-containing diguanylate cyclase n=1 Tax=Roseibium album TaxID=311410 RepID=UPI003BB1C0B1
MTLAQVQIETERLEALRRLALLHSEHLHEFDAAVSNASYLFDCPMAVISIVDAEEIWFKAAFGLDATETHRENSFCGHTILSDDVLIVPDAQADSRFCDIPLVTGDVGARFYAGCPVVVDDKHRIGTICVIDTKPRSVSEEQIAQLRNLAKIVEGLIKAHKAGLETREALQEAQLEQDRARRNQDLLKEITLVSGVGGWEYDPKTDAMTWTAKTREIHEVGPDIQPNLNTALSFYPSDSRKALRAAFETAFETGCGWDLELNLVTAGDRQIWVRVVGNPVFEGGSVRRIIGALQDISDSKRKQEEVRTSEVIQRTTLEALQEGILLVSPSGKIQSSNKAASQLLGYPETTLVGSNVHDLQLTFQDVADAGSHRVSPLVLAVTDPGQDLDLEVQLTEAGSGQVRWLRINARPVDENSVHGPDCVVVSLTDITKVKQQSDTLQGFFDNFPGGLVHYNTQLQLTFWNEEFARLLNLPHDFLDQRPNLRQVIRYLADRGDYGPGDPALIAGERLDRYGAGNRHAYERRTSDGKVLEVRGTPLPGGGSVSSFLDITRRKRMEEQLVEKEQLASNRLFEMEAVIANMRQGVSVFDGEGRITLWNTDFQKLFGKPDGEIRKGMTLVEMLQLEKERGEFHDDPYAFYAALREKLDAGKVIKTNFKHPNGTIISIVRTPLPDGGWVGMHEDVTSREKATEEITYAAHHDTLTGLANRTLFNLKLEDAIARTEHHDETSDLLMIDLDHFKPVNDTYGHDVGDDLLRQAAMRLNECVRTKDTVARLGGDEFAIIVRNTAGDRDLASRIAERVVEKLKKPYHINGNILEISASVGIASISGEQVASPILKKADLALYAVKNEGRDGYRHFEENAVETD